jgi:hypothetical protein
VQAAPTANLPAATVMGVVERTNAGDIEGALAYFADDATLYLVGLPPTGIEFYHGKQQIRSFWEDNVSNHLQWEVEISSVVGDVVTAHVKTWHDFTRELGVAPLEWLDIYEVKDGKITAYSGTITEEALARLKPALAEVMPPEPPAAPSSETPVSELTVTISGGTCTYDGPMTLQAGEIQVTMDVQDQDKTLYALTFFTLDPDKDVLDLMASTVRPDPPPWADMISMHTLGAGKSATYSFTAEEGPVYGICWSQPPDLSIGVVGPFNVNPPAPTPPTDAPATQATPTAGLLSATVMSMTERMNAGDLDGAMAYWADDAVVYFFGLPPTGTEIYTGKEQFRPVFEENVSSHLQWEVDIGSIVGDEVNARAKNWHDFTRQLGVAPLEATEVYVIHDGKIVSYAWTLTEESLARLKPALAEVMPPEPPTAPSSENPVSELTVTISGGTCIYDGPMALQAGEIRVTMDVRDQDKTLYALTFFNLDPDKDFADLMASTVRFDPPPWADMVSIHTLGAGKSATYSFTAEEGPVYLVCWSQPPDLPIGAVGPFTVNPFASPPSPSSEGPVSEMTITISEGACTYDGPMTLQAGEITVTADVKDVDKEEYLLTFINLLDPDKTFADLMAATSGDAPPDWVDTISEKHLSPGESQTYSFTLEAGPVYLICWSTPPERTIGKKGPFEVMP